MSTQASGTGSPAWQVTGQTPDFGAGPAGLNVPGWKVTFKLNSGSAGSVFIPATQYSAANVKALIAPLAAEMAAVDGITSDT